MEDVHILINEACESLNQGAPEKARAAFAELLGVKSFFDTDTGIEIVKACLDYAQALTSESLQEIDPSEISAEASRCLRHAEQLLQAITDRDPESFRALGLMGVIHTIYYRSSEALACFERALAVAPDNAALRYNQAYSLCELGRLDEAGQTLVRLVGKVPEDGMAWHLLGQVRQLLENHEASLEAYQKAISRLPYPVKSYMGLHNAYARLGRPNEAIRILQEGVRQCPGSRELCTQLGMFALSVGDWRTGWRYYHCRESVNQNRQPIPEGSIFPWKRDIQVRVRFEQGLGDELFFLRFLPVLKARGMTVNYATQTKLFPLLKGNPLFGELTAVLADQQWDWDAVVGDLPYIAGMFSDSDMPPPFALQVQDELQKRLRDELARFGPGPYLGVVWQGGKPREAGRKGVWKFLHKEISPSMLGALVRNWPGQVVVLQRLLTEEDKRGFSEAYGKAYLDWTALNDDLPELLAGLSLLDEYVGVSSTNMHLLAGIGKTARVLVPQQADWRWMAEGEASPWFPRFKIYRQDKNAAWGDTLIKLGKDLEERWG